MKIIKWLLLPVFLLIWYLIPVFSISIFTFLIEYISDWWTIIIFLLFTLISGIILWLSILIPSLIGNLAVAWYNNNWTKYIFSIVGAISMYLILSTLKYNPQIRPFIHMLKEILNESLLKGGLLSLLILEFVLMLIYSFVLAPIFITSQK